MLIPAMPPLLHLSASSLPSATSIAAGRIKGLCWQHLGGFVSKIHGVEGRPIESEKIQSLSFREAILQNLIRFEKLGLIVSCVYG